MKADARVELINRIEKYTAPVLTGVCSFLFFLIVPFLPGYPVLPALVSLALTYVSARKPRAAAVLFYLLVLTSVVWQLVGFGLMQLIVKPAGLIFAVVILAPLFMAITNPRLSAASLSLTLLGVGVMLTPQYYLSIPLVAAAIVMGNLRNVAADAITFFFTLAPFMLVENALYYTSPGVSPSASPLIFSQLSRLAAGIRPPLPGINFLLTGIPPGLFSPNIPAVVGYLTEKSYVLLIPMAVFAIIFTVSVSAAGLLTRIRDRLARFARVYRGLRLVWPAVVTMTTTVIFAGLILALSPADLVGYQTELAQDPTHAVLGAMMIGAAVFGTALSVNDYLNSLMRKAALSRESLLQAIGSAQNLIGELRALVEKVGRSAPPVGLRVESSVLDEYSSYISDIRRQMGSSNSQAFSTWDGDLRGRIIPTLESLPEQVRVKVVNELNSVISTSSSLNNTMEHVGAETIFPGEGLSVAGFTTEEALDTYLRFTAEVKEKVSELYASYMSAASALDILLNRTVSEPPVNPEVLVSTQDYVTAMRLLAEDYSMTFHLEHKDELEAKAQDLADRLSLLAGALEDEDRSKLEPFLDLGTIRPIDSAHLLTKVQGAISAIRSIIDGAVSDAEHLSSLVATLMPAATAVMKFETLTEMGRLKELMAESDSLGPGLGQAAKFAVKAKEVLEAHRQAEKNDGENLMMIAQYPLAQKLISELAETKRVISLSELPFQEAAANLYAKIYAASHPPARYDHQNEALLLNHA